MRHRTRRWTHSSPSRRVPRRPGRRRSDRRAPICRVRRGLSGTRRGSTPTPVAAASTLPDDKGEVVRLVHDVGLGDLVLRQGGEGVDNVGVLVGEDRCNHDEAGLHPRGQQRRVGGRQGVESMGEDDDRVRARRRSRASCPAVGVVNEPPIDGYRSGSRGCGGRRCLPARGSPRTPVVSVQVTVCKPTPTAVGCVVDVVDPVVAAVVVVELELDPLFLPGPSSLRNTETSTSPTTTASVIEPTARRRRR